MRLSNNWKTIHLRVQARKPTIRKPTVDEEKYADCKCGNAGDDCGAAAVLGIIARNSK
jgi:hypothetical protein